MRRQQNAVRLEFDPGRQVHTNLSGAAFHGRWLFVAGDESGSVDILERLPPVGDEALRFGGGREFALADLLSLPGKREDEADIEGLAVVDDWLWVVGSHGWKRKRAKVELDHARNANRLAKVALDANRRLVARIPIVVDDAGTPSLASKGSDGRQAMRLEGDQQANALTALLADDPHLGPFMTIPGKDNGFDIEGIAWLDSRVFLGLRGPVLRGWSVMLEIALGERDDALVLEPIDDQGRRYRKHFLALEGLGVRDLYVRGDDLHLLAGPTMVLDGDVRLFTWPRARGTLAGCVEPAVFHHHAIVESVALPHSRGPDRAEALCKVSDALSPDADRWLVLYDAPGKGRQAGPGIVFGDLLVGALRAEGG